MKIFAQSICIFLIAATLSGCSIYNDPDIPECPVDVRIELQWIDTEPLSDTENVDVKAYNGSDLIINTTSDIYGTDVILAPDRYEVVGYEQSPNISISGHTISVATDGNSRMMPINKFSAGVGSGTVLPNRAHQVIYLPMREQVRELIIMVEFTGNLAQGVTGIDGDLEGVTLSRDINDAFPTASGRQRPYAISRTDEPYDFSREQRGNEDIWFSGTRNLIGIDGDSDQILNLEATLSDGQAINYPVDVTGMMTGFHTENVSDPWYIILKLNLDLDMLITIEDWYGGTDSNMIAE